MYCPAALGLVPFASDARGTGRRSSSPRRLTGEMAPRPRARVLPVGNDGDAVDYDVVDAAHVVERVRERRPVLEAVEVDHDQVGRVTLAYEPALAEAEVRGRHARHLPD